MFSWSADRIIFKCILVICLFSRGTQNKYIEKYFYGWFIDEYCSLPVEKEQNFETSYSIYAKWIKTDSTVFNYKVSNGEATITGRKNKTAGYRICK